MGHEGSQRSHLRNRMPTCNIWYVKQDLDPSFPRAFLYQIHRRRHLIKVCANTK